MSRQEITCYIIFAVFVGTAIWSVTLGHTVLAGVLFTIAALMAYAGILNPSAIKEINIGKDKGIKIFSPEEREKVLQTSMDELKPELKKELEELVKDAHSRKESERAPEDYLALANEAFKERKYSYAIAFSLAGLQLIPADKRTRSTLIYRLGTSYDELGAPALAKKLHMESMREDPDLPLPHNGLGTNYHEQGEYEEAEKHYQKAIDLDPNYASPHNNLGALYSEQGKQEEAEEAYKKVIDLDASFSMPYNNLGNLYLEQDKQKEAEEHYKKAIDLDPNYAAPFCNLGLLYREQGKQGEAEEYFKKAKELDPNIGNP